MFKKVQISNYKSIVDLNMQLGDFTLLIGANGCGKSNILEAITLAAAASTQKLDYEYFANRGMRVVQPNLMFPAFPDVETEEINIKLWKSDESIVQFALHYESEAKPPRWENKSNLTLAPIKIVAKNGKEKITDAEFNFLLYNAIKNLKPSKSTLSISAEDIEKIRKGLVFSIGKSDLNSFLIYSLEETKLRAADNDNRIFPLGRNGEGLFAYLKVLAQREDGKNIIDEIKENLQVLDWFKDMTIPENQLSNEFLINLKDYYMSESIKDFNQKSTNEGFLYLLFYLTLIISDETPSFFAIDNIDSAFNPKMCREVTKHLIQLARKHHKQIIATTHNPAVLDGLNLYEDGIVLNVVRRTIDGDTRVSRVKPKEELNIPLSEAWMKGYIGGLPDNF